MLVKRDVNEKFEEQVVKIKEKMEDIKLEMSDARKHGKNTKIAEAYMLNIIPKCKMAIATYEQVDLDEAYHWLEMFEKEVHDAVQGDPFEKDLQLIHEAYEHLFKGEKAEAAKIYQQLKDRYQSYPEDLRRLIYAACMDIHKMLAS